MIDWDQIDQMHKEAVDDLAEITQKLRDGGTNSSLSEDVGRHLSLRGQLALNILQLQPPSSGFPADLFMPNPEPTPEEATATS